MTALVGSQSYLVGFLLNLSVESSKLCVPSSHRFWAVSHPRSEWSPNCIGAYVFSISPDSLDSHAADPAQRRDQSKSFVPHPWARDRMKPSSDTAEWAECEALGPVCVAGIEAGWSGRWFDLTWVMKIVCYCLKSNCVSNSTPVFGCLWPTSVCNITPNPEEEQTLAGGGEERDAGAKGPPLPPSLLHPLSHPLSKPRRRVGEKAFATWTQWGPVRGAGARLAGSQGPILNGCRQGAANSPSLSPRARAGAHPPPTPRPNSRHLLAVTRMRGTQGLWAAEQSRFPSAGRQCTWISVGSPSPFVSCLLFRTH